MHQAELDLAEALAAELRVEVRRPQPALLDLLLQRRDRALEAVLAELVDDRLERPDLLAHELAHPVELLLELGLGREVPRRAPSLSASFLARHARGSLLPRYLTIRNRMARADERPIELLACATSLYRARPSRWPRNRPVKRSTSAPALPVNLKLPRSVTYRTQARRPRRERRERHAAPAHEPTARGALDVQGHRRRLRESEPDRRGHPCAGRHTAAAAAARNIASPRFSFLAAVVRELVVARVRDRELRADLLAQDVGGIIPSVVQGARADGARQLALRGAGVRRVREQPRHSRAVVRGRRVPRRASRARIAQRWRRPAPRSGARAARRAQLLEQELRERAASSSGASGRSCTSGSALPDHRQQVPLGLARAPADGGELERPALAREVHAGLEDADDAPANVAEHLPEAQLLRAHVGPPAARRPRAGARACPSPRPGGRRSEPPRADAEPAEVLDRVAGVAELPVQHRGEARPGRRGSSPGGSRRGRAPGRGGRQVGAQPAQAELERRVRLADGVELGRERVDRRLAPARRRARRPAGTSASGTACVAAAAAASWSVSRSWPASDGRAASGAGSPRPRPGA